MVNSTKVDRTEKLGITLPKSLLHEIDKRGDIPRSKYIRRVRNRNKNSSHRYPKSNLYDSSFRHMMFGQ